MLPVAFFPAQSLSEYFEFYDLLVVAAIVVSGMKIALKFRI